MAIDVEVRSEYGGLMLTCDEEAFARIQSHILDEPSVAEAIGQMQGGLHLRFISIAKPTLENASRARGRLIMLSCIIGGGISSAATIVGYITIVKWLMQ